MINKHGRKMRKTGYTIEFAPLAPEAAACATKNRITTRHYMSTCHISVPFTLSSYVEGMLSKTWGLKRSSVDEWADVLSAEGAAL